MAQVNGMDLNSIEDEVVLYGMLDQAVNSDERKRIRNRLKDVQAVKSAQREEMMKKREEERESAIRDRFNEAAQQKKRTLAMYDQMAKSAPAGGEKVMDINIYKNADGTTAIPVVAQPKRDLVEEGIQERKREAEERKRRMLAAYDNAARSAPAGAPKFVDFEAVNKNEVPNVTPAKPPASCTFSMSGGIPQVTKVSSSNPGTPYSPFYGTPSFPTEDEVDLDPMERDIRARKRAADEEKRRTLAAYSMISRMGGGPQNISVEEFKYLNVDETRLTPTPKSSCTTAFRGGVIHLC